MVIFCCPARLYSENLNHVKTKLKHLLERKDPFRTVCNDEDCKPCVNSQDTKSKLLNCKKNRICYSAKCRKCGEEGKPRIYHGETARNLFIRSKEHYSALRNKSDKSFMHKHIMKEHKGKAHEVDFDWKIVGKYRKPLSRQLAEAIEIEKNPKTVISTQRMNTSDIQSRK